MRRLLSLAVLTTGLALALTGTALADAGVTIGDDGLDPETVRVDIREPIVWTNATDADVSLVGEEPNWVSGPIQPGATFSIEVTRAGTYTYGSEDGSLEGEIVVAAAEGAGADPTEAATDPAVDEEVKPRPAKPRMPETGVNSVVPGVLSVMLIGFGGGLLQLTHPRRRGTPRG